MLLYHTRTYIVSDFDHDRDIVEQLMKWNNSKYWELKFSDAMIWSLAVIVACIVRKKVFEKAYEWFEVFCISSW